jgi:hypothetical protein
MKERRIVGSMVTPGTVEGRGYCDRCGTELRVYTKQKGAPLHLCRPCRSDKWFIQAVTGGNQWPSST